MFSDSMNRRNFLTSVAAASGSGLAQPVAAAKNQVIGIQIGTYRPGEPNGMAIEMTYLEPDAEHPRGQSFDGAGNPMPLH